jgi:hypothetical protein
MGTRLAGRTVEEKLRFNVEYVGSTCCLLWTGTKTGNGYGSIHLNGSSVPVHRVAYELWVGPLHADDTVDHKPRCRRALCINPAHLEAVSGPENTRRMNAALREIKQAADLGIRVACGRPRPGSGTTIYCEMEQTWHRTHRVPGSHLHHGRGKGGRWYTWEDR